MFKRHVNDIVLHYSAAKHDTTDDSWMYSCPTDNMERSKINRTVKPSVPKKRTTARRSFWYIELCVCYVSYIALMHKVLHGRIMYYVI